MMAMEVLEDRTLLAAAIDNSWQRIDPVGSLMFERDFQGSLTQTTDVFADDFESGALGGSWTTRSSTLNGRIGVSNVLGTPVNNGSYHLAMDTTVSGPDNLNEAILTVDLSGLTNVDLHFAHKDVGDEDTALPSTFTGGVIGDGVSISEDGTNWYTLVNLNDTNSPNNVFTEFSFDLDAVAATAGISLSSSFQIKFQQYDNFSFSADGRTFDDILIQSVIAPPADSTTVFLEGGQTLTVVATPDDSATTLTVNVFDSSNGLLGSATAASGGEPVDLQTIAVASDGDYRVEITGDFTSAFDLSLFRNATVEVMDTADGNELDATDSFIELGSGRFGVVGTFDGRSSVEPPVQSGPIYSTHNDGRSLGTISKASGIGSDIGPFGYGQTWAAAFGTDGTLYTLINGFTGNAQLASVNQTTGAATPIGNGLGVNMISLEVASDGTMYGIGYNNRILYRINKSTGVGTPIGDTGISACMDLAFDSAGTLYATVGNTIWTVNRATAASAFLGTYSGIVSGEVMGIMFDADDTLFATAYVSNSPLYAINLNTFSATVIGNTGFLNPHGGDIFIGAEFPVSESGTILSTPGTQSDIYGDPGEPGRFPNGPGAVAQPLAPNELLINGSFETGNFTGWTTVTTAGPFRPWAVTGAGQGGGFDMLQTQPQDGAFVAWNGFDGGGPMEFQMYQDVSIAAGSSATLSWMDRVQWNFFSPTPQARLYDVEIRNPVTNTVLQSVYSFSTGTTTGLGNTNWQSHSVDVSSFAGQTVRIFFREQIPQSATGPGQIEFDAISLKADNGETMYGGNSRGSALNPGGILLIDQSTAVGTLLADPITPGGLPGLDFDSAGRLWGSSIDGPFGNRVSNLVEINPDTGALISSVPITRNGIPVSIGDLAVQPGTDVIFGVHSNTDATNFPGGELYTIDRATGAATVIGNANSGGSGGISFTTDGRLFQTAFSAPGGFGSLNELNPANAARISTTALSPALYLDGLGIRPSDGKFFGVLGGTGDQVFTIDPTTGIATFVGNTGAGSPSDLAFREPIAAGPDVDEYLLDLTGRAGLPIDIAFSTDVGQSTVVDDIDLAIILSTDPATAPVAELQATGLFGSITVFDVRNSTPTLTALQGFESILAFTNFAPANPVALGNVLADYVDNGGHLAMATYGYSNPWDIEGRITTTGYSPLINMGINGSVSGNLVATVPTDRIFDGIDVNVVTYFNNGNFAHPGLDAGATLLATDGAGNNMIARNADGNVIGLNFYPQSLASPNNQELFDLIGNTLLVQATGSGSATLELLDTDGTTVLATGTSVAGNFDLGILDLVVPADGVYTVRVSSSGQGRYGIVVTNPLVFDSEGNQPTDSPLRSLDGHDGALGFLGDRSVAGVGDIDLSLLTSFESLTLANSGFIPPDPILAAGPSSVIAMVNTDIAIHDKTTGAVIAQGDFDGSGGFWSTSNTVFDPWIVFDPDSNRFIAMGIDRSTAGLGSSRVYLAVSTDSTPTNLTTDWNKYIIDRTGHSVTGATTFPDYPKLGVNDDAIFITGNDFGIIGGAFSHVSLFAIEKAPLLSGGPVNIVYDEVIGGAAFSIHPVTVYDAGSPMYFSQAGFGGGNAITLHAITNVLTAPVRTTSIVAVSGYSFPPDVPQLGGPALDSVDARIMSGVVRDGKLWTAHSVQDLSTDTETVVRWYEFDVSSFPAASATLVQSGNVDPGPGVHTWMPNISVDNDGDMGIAFSISGAAQFAGIGYTGRLASDSPGSTRPVQIARMGDGSYSRFDGIGRNRWGDYSGLSVDPDGESFWLYNEYPAVGNNWATFVGEFQLEPSGPPVPDVDTYEITLAIGQTIGLSTTTPFDGLIDNLNTLDPSLQILDPNGVIVAFDSNSGTDGRNAALSSFMATTSGVYRVIVASETDGTGEYVLGVNWAPVIQDLALSANEIFENESVSLTGAFSDQNLDDSHTVAVDWDDPNAAADSTFTLPAISVLGINDLFHSTTDGAVLKVTAIELLTGTVRFEVSEHQYLDDGVAPGNNSIADSSTVSVTITDSGGLVAAPSAQEFIVNGDFETGDLTGWNLSPGSATWLINDGTLDPDGPGAPLAPIAGSFDATSVQSGPGLSMLTEPIVVPAAVSSAILSWSDRIRNHALEYLDPGQEWRVLVLDSSGGLIQEVFSTDPGDPLTQLGPNQWSFDLTTLFQSLGGQTIQVSFEQQSQVYFMNVSLDNVSLQIAARPTVLVKNVAPTLVLDSVAAVNENESATLTGIITDPGMLDVHDLVIGWDDPNASANSTFIVAATSMLNVGDTFNSTTDGAVLEITAIDPAAGKVSFSVQHVYADDGVAPGNGTISDVSTVSAVVSDDDLVSSAGLSGGPIYTTLQDGTRLGTINPATGLGTDIGPFGSTQTWAAAFDTDGTLYTLINGFTGNAILASVDPTTGAITTIGTGFGTNMISLEVATDGTMYGIGYVDQILYEIDQTTGTATAIGSTGISFVMDLAIDSTGTMYATVDNQIWTVDRTTTASTLLGTFSGILSGSVMGIMFDENDALFATAYVPDSPLYDIDLGTLAASVVGGGNTGFFLPHGGDIYVSAGTATTNVLVRNAAPQITSFVDPAPASSKGDEGESVTLSLDFTDAGLLDVHTVTVLWGDGNSDTVVLLTGDRSITIDHAYAVGGIYTINVTVSDDDAGSDSFTTAAFITGVGIQNVNGENVLYIIGTSDDDLVTVNQQGNGLLRVHASFIDDNGGRTFQRADVDRIVAFLCEGDDHMTVAGNITFSTLIDAGGGDDHINGGGGSDVILGRDGDDHINGGGGRDILIGGFGYDRLVGGTDDDLLFGGVFSSTAPIGGVPIASFLDDEDDLLAIQQAWNDASRTAAERSAEIESLDNFFTKLFDDDSQDVLTGSSEDDWFLLFAGDSATDGKGKKSHDIFRNL